MNTPEEVTQTKLELIKEAIIGNKCTIDNLDHRSQNMEGRLGLVETHMHELHSSTIRTDERIATVQRYLDAMSIDIRAVRNSVVGAIFTAIVIGTAGLAFSNFGRIDDRPFSRSEWKNQPH